MPARSLVAQRGSTTSLGLAHRVAAHAASRASSSTEGDASVKAEAVIRAYHGTLVPPFCLASARGFFQGVVASGG